MSVSDWSLLVCDWRRELEGFKSYLGPALGRRETRFSGGAFLDGLLSGATRKTGWMLSEEAGLSRPYRIQSLLGRSRWRADALCKRARDYALERWVLLRRSLKNPEDMAYYFAFVRERTSLEEMAAASGLRWTIETCFLRAKEDLGLDHCEARSWHGWHRHMSLVVAAAAFLAKLAADQKRAAFQPLPDREPAKDLQRAERTSPKSAKAANNKALAFQHEENRTEGSKGKRNKRRPKQATISPV
jgi:SRSO17 transposase